jgi:opacity protein-like surface antigen
MKKFALATAIALALGGTAHAALFDYGQLLGGATFEPKLHNGFFGNKNMDMHTGYNFGAALGWNLSPELSAEIEGLYTNSPYDDQISGGFSASLETFSVMANAFWNFDIGSKWKPFIGAGIGGIQVTVSDGSFFGTPFGGSSDFVFGYQGMAGFTYPVSGDIDFVVEGRYQAAASDASVSVNFGPPKVSFKQEYDGASVSAGLRFHL